MGDLNANMFLTAPEATYLKQTACKLNLKLVDHGATHHHVDGSRTWIDVIFTDDEDVVLDSNNMAATYHNRHNIIDVSIDLSTSQKITLGKFTYRNFKEIRQEELVSLLNNYDWSFTNCSDLDVDVRLEQLGANIVKALDQVAPIKEFRPHKKIHPPWVDTDLKEMYDRRDALRRRYLRTRNHDIWNESQSLALLAEQRSNEA